MEDSSNLYRVAQQYIAPIVKRYARLEVVGAQHLPNPHQGALLACNHSGSFWWDALCLITALSDRRVHFIAHHWDAKIPLLKKPLDMIECSFLDEHEDQIDDDCEVVSGLRAGKQMCIYPEESYHSFRHRYTLFKFSPHVVRYAQKADVPIVPIHVIGAEEAAPTLIGLKKEKVPLHVPFHLPIILPLKITIDIGLPIDPKELTQMDCPEDVLRQRMYKTISQYRKCKLSDDKYIDKKSWLL